MELALTDVQNWTPAQRREELERSLSGTAAFVLRTATILKVMIEKKEDVSRLPRSWIKSMLSVASGVTIPEVMVEFDGLARRIVSRMPLEAQRQLCADPVVDVVDSFGLVRKKNIRNLGSTELSRVFDYNKIRPVSEQMQVLDSEGLQEEPRKVSKTFEDALQYFEKSRDLLGHIEELNSLYQMIGMLRARVEKKRLQSVDGRREGSRYEKKSAV